ncbi:hypothetical protein NDS46_31605 (plasmid) [Paenibacillus thiaminolyticus]|uniref:hypothetical protein n=1 Tax=Paenibacillus thiaminolyticus TaxID=49283 RepID=UPI00232AD116|nr:hypothetical protein [Paenibacillus thiaminolyticus]WCF11505.1 hypothetical protein NDS46_31605 [Paenibacillus thiaminolyticus]
MKVQKLFDLFSNGKHPAVQFTKKIEEYETIFDEGMRGRVYNVKKGSHRTFTVHFEIKEFEAYNIELMKPDYYDSEGNPTKKAIETSFYPKDGIESICFQHDEDVPCILVEDHNFFDLYKASDSTESYLTWLEKQLLDSKDAWKELSDSLGKDILALEDLKSDNDNLEKARLGGKVEGAKLALSRIQNIKQQYFIQE